MANKMEQDSGDNSTNVQIAGNVQIGLTASEARQIALDVFKANFYEFSEKAAKKALERAEELTDEFVSKFYTQFPNLESKLQEPSVQSSMFNTQKEYAKTGDKDLKEQLLDILLQRINSDERSLKQIVLDEAITILPKLTRDQINILTFIWSAIYYNHRNIVNLASFEDLYNNKLARFFPDNKASYSFFTHLQFTGCCTILPEGSTYKPLVEIFKNRYKALFIKGFLEEEFTTEFKEDTNKLRPLLIKCLRNPLSLQFNSLNDAVFDSKVAELNLGILGDRVKAFENRFLMNDQEVENYLISKSKKTKPLLTDWSNTAIKSIQPTSVGYAIAIMNFNRQTNANIDFESFL